MAVLPVSLWRVGGFSLGSARTDRRWGFYVFVVDVLMGLKVVYVWSRVSHKKSCGSSLPSLATLSGDLRREFAIADGPAGRLFQ
jgi:hypothetical protein